MKKIVFVAMLFCTGASALFGGGVELYEYLNFRLNGRNAMMVLVDPPTKVTLQTGGYDMFVLNVKYVGTDGEILVPQKPLSGNMARQLAKGEKIPVTYLKHNPKQVRFADSRLPNPWIWLALGTVLMGTFFYALKLLRNETEETAD